MLAINGGPKVLPEGIQVTWPGVDRKDEEAVLRVLRSGKWWRGGTIEDQAASECGRFERDFAAYQDAPYGLAVNNGTIALELALRAAGVKRGDEVVVPVLSFVVTASAVLPLGAVPVFADCDPDTYQIDPDALEEAICPRTTCICIVHFGGYPADLDRIVSIAEKHSLPLVEDAAHAHGSQWRGKGLGSYGDFGTFSFQQFKSLTCGEGGIVLAKSLEGWQTAYAFHNLGRRESAGFYDFYTMSSNYRMTDLQGALLNSQFAKMKELVPQKVAAAERLGSRLKEIGGLTPLPKDERITRRGYYYYLLHYDPQAFKQLPRERFLEAVRAEGVAQMGHAYGKVIHRYPLFQDMQVPPKYCKAQYRKAAYPNAERVMAEELVSLHHVALLADNETLDRIAEAVGRVKENVDELLGQDEPMQEEP